MNTLCCLPYIAFLLFTSATYTHAAPPEFAAPDSKALSPAQLIKGYGKLPLGFEANQGQTDPQVERLQHACCVEDQVNPNDSSMEAPEIVVSFHAEEESWSR